MKLYLVLTLMSVFRFLTPVAADCHNTWLGDFHDGDHICGGDSANGAPNVKGIYVCNGRQWLLAADCGPRCNCGYVGA
ncbi:hypothetical protein BT63DRAFT_481113, partial [Microthyrium microscopicum]